MNRIATALAVIISTLALSTIARADDLKADHVHSFVIFDIHHFNAGYVYGTFADPTGTVTYDPSDLTKTAFDISVDTDTLDTRNANRDADIKGADFFDVKQFPTMTFKSTSVAKTGDTTMNVTGDLTVHGVTKSITVPMEMTGSGPGMHGETRTGFRGEFKINRHDYQIDKDPDSAVGAEIHIVVAIEAVNQ
jgi:polyisoprenoid-binding protein YceI